MKTKIRKAVIRRWVLGIVVGYLLVGLALYFLQEKFLFHPEVIPADQPLQIAQPHEEMRMRITDDRVVHITRFPVADSIRQGVVLYFHGNRGNVERHASQADLFLPHNWEVWMPDYPGYGKSTGERSEETMKEEAELLFKLARSRFAADSIIIYGRSMGSGPATWLASRVDCRRLVLESAFTSIPALMRNYAFLYPTEWMANYQFDNAERLPEVDAPVTIFHGTDDHTVGIKHARRLAGTRQTQTTLIEIDGAGHNNMREFPGFVDAVGELLKTPATHYSASMP